MPPDSVPKMDTFEGELTGLINKYSLESLSNTPDFILAFYLKDCLLAWQNAQTRRTAWYTKKIENKIKEDNELSGNREESRPSQMGNLE